MVDNHIKRSLNLLHINKCNQVDILVEASSCFSNTLQEGDDVPKEEYMETAGISRRSDDLFTDCVVYVSDTEQLMIDHQRVGKQYESGVSPKASEDAVVAIEFVQQNELNVKQQHLALEQLKNICRCCLSDERDLQSLYENENCIADMIMAIATIQLSSSDNLPSQICMQCVLQLSSALSFKQQMETADDTLRRFVDQGYLDGTKLISLNGPELMDESEPISNKSSSVDLITETTEAIDIVIEDDSVQDKQHSSPELDVLYEKMLNQPSASDLIEDRLLHQPMDLPHSDENQSKQTSSFESNFIDEEALLTDLNYDDDPNTLLQPLERHQLPRDDDEDDDEDGDEEDEKDEYDEDDEEDEDDDVVNDDESLTMDDEEDISSLADPSKVTIDKEPESMQAFASTGDIKTNTNKSPDRKDTKETQELNCRLCNNAFSDKSKLNQHLKTQHDYSKTAENSPDKIVDKTQANESKPIGPVYHCKECVVDFSVERDLRIHRSLHRKDGKFECVECNKQCSSTVQLKRHIRIHFEDKPHKCAVCDKGFPERGSLTRHFRKHTDFVREKKHVCSLCDKKYYDSHSLSVHSRTHTGERPWVCLACGKSFIDSRLLNSHSKVHSSDKPHACPICDRRFTHPSTLTTHVRTHTGEKPYVCAMCGKSFIQSSNLMLHMRTHSGEKPYKCSVCSRTFASSSTLNIHNRTHTGEKPFNCEICNKRFARQDLTAHMRIHKGEKPFECTSCKRKFTTSAQLTQHIRTHTGEHPFECKVCNKSCSSASYLKKHLLAHINAPIENPSVSSSIISSSSAANALSSHPSTFYAINKLSAATSVDPKMQVVDVDDREPSNATEEIDEVSGKHIYQAIDPSIFRIQQVRSVGHSMVTADTNFDQSKNDSKSTKS